MLSLLCIELLPNCCLYGYFSELIINFVEPKQTGRDKQTATTILGQPLP